MSLNCLCGFVNNLGSLNDDNIDFRELSNELQKEFNIERLKSDDISEESLDELSKNPESLIRGMVTRHKNLSTKTLIQMAKDDFEIFDSIPSKGELIETDDQNVDLFSEFFDQKRVLMKEILKSKHCNSDVIKNLIATKHDSYTKYIS